MASKVNDMVKTRGHRSSRYFADLMQHFNDAQNAIR